MKDSERSLGNDPFEVLWTIEAVEDLDEAYNKMSRYSESFAQRVIQKLYSIPEYLALYPEIGRKESLLISLKKGYRRLIEEDYKIIYSINFKDRKVYIHSVFYCGDEPSNLIEKMKRRE